MSAEKNNLKEKLRRAKLYCITTQPRSGEDIVQKARRVVASGADILQLRDKVSSVRERIQMGKVLAEICHQSGALFFMNDRIDLALAADADGVHLGQEDLPLIEARLIRNSIFRDSRDFLIGISTHSIDQALEAERDGADYLGCGPIFATPTKAGRAAVGLNLIQEYRQKIKIPFVAIGGINASNLDQVIESGASCVAVVRAAFETENIEPTVGELKSRMQSVVAA